MSLNVLGNVSSEQCMANLTEGRYFYCLMSRKVYLVQYILTSLEVVDALDENEASSLNRLGKLLLVVGASEDVTNFGSDGTRKYICFHVKSGIFKSKNCFNSPQAVFKHVSSLCALMFGKYRITLKWFCKNFTFFACSSSSFSQHSSQKFSQTK